MQEESIRREQQLVQTKDRELIQAQQQLREMVANLLHLLHYALTSNMIPTLPVYRSSPEGGRLVNLRGRYIPVRL